MKCIMDIKSFTSIYFTPVRCPRNPKITYVGRNSSQDSVGNLYFIVHTLEIQNGAK